MPRITKEQKKENIAAFSNDAVKLINEHFNLNEYNEPNFVSRKEFISDGWYYYLHKSTIVDLQEIRVRRQNYKQYKDQPKGNRVNEQAWVYQAGTNNRISDGKDHGFIIDGFSIQDYIKEKR